MCVCSLLIRRREKNMIFGNAERVFFTVFFYFCLPCRLFFKGSTASLIHLINQKNILASRMQGFPEFNCGAGIFLKKEFQMSDASVASSCSSKPAIFMPLWTFTVSPHESPRKKFKYSFHFIRVAHGGKRRLSCVHSHETRQE